MGGDRDGATAPTATSGTSTSETTDPGTATPATTTTVTPDEAAAAATALCPVLLDHLSAIGAAFNRAAEDVATLETGADRRVRWMAALDEMEQDNAELRDALDGLDGAGVAALVPIVADVRAGADASDDVLDDIRALFDEDPTIDDQRHQMRTSQVIVRVEKVISRVRPEMNDYGDPALNAAFRDHDNCRNAVREVDDGATSDL